MWFIGAKNDTKSYYEQVSQKCSDKQSKKGVGDLFLAILYQLTIIEQNAQHKQGKLTDSKTILHFGVP